jgi:hypothetical protein
MKRDIKELGDQRRETSVLNEHVRSLKLTQIKNKLGDLYRAEDEETYLEFVDAMGVELLGLRVAHYYVFKKSESMKGFSTLNEFLKLFKSK